MFVFYLKYMVKKIFTVYILFSIGINTFAKWKKK